MMLYSIVDGVCKMLPIREIVGFEGGGVGSLGLRELC